MLRYVALVLSLALAAPLQAQIPDWAPNCLNRLAEEDGNFSREELLLCLTRVTRRVDRQLDALESREAVTVDSVNRALIAGHNGARPLEQVQAQAICTALRGPQDQVVTATRRPPVTPGGRTVRDERASGFASCAQVCGSIIGVEVGAGRNNSCFGAIHIYGDGTDEERGPYRANGLSDTRAPLYGLRTKVYGLNACEWDNFGPNYCCCSGLE